MTASLMLRKLGSYRARTSGRRAARSWAASRRTLFILDWLQSVELRHAMHAPELNKGEARNALARAVFFNATLVKSVTAVSSSSATGPAASTL